MKDLIGKNYQIVYADPAWTFKDKNTGGTYKSGSTNKYNVMSLKDMCDLPVPQITAENCLLAMWWVGSQPIEAVTLARAWGFKFKTMTGITWHKETKDGNDAFGMGHLSRQSTENCLFAIKGKNKRINASVRNFISSVRLQHSQKPDEARNRLVTLMGDVPRIELFARERAKGWFSWGDEI